MVESKDQRVRRLEEALRLVEGKGNVVLAKSIREALQRLVGGSERGS